MRASEGARLLLVTLLSFGSSAVAPAEIHVEPTQIGDPGTSRGDSDLEVLGDGRSAVRLVFLDLGPFGQLGGEALAYDPEEVLGALREADLAAESELSLAVRLVISEVGADRLLESEFGLDEAVGILQTVRNRMDRTHVDPEGVGHAPDFPGCGPGGTFHSCANADEYLGMATWRALDPGSHYDAELLLAAADRAVAAYWLAREELLDVAAGATSYVHRCGGAAYGMKTFHCDAHLGRPDRDVPGGHPHTGPVLFKRPSTFDAARGFYRLTPVSWVDYQGVIPD